MSIYSWRMASRFISPPNVKEYQLNVWDVVKQIPPGKVATYGQIAMLVGVPGGVMADNYRALGARWVGQAMVGCPVGVPWQRVINAQGKISLSGSSAETQRQLLEEEGVIFDAHGRVDLKKYQWQKPAA